MDSQKESVSQSFDRLQRLLLAMRAGDELRASDASSVTGLSIDTCRAVFKGLERAGLMSDTDGDLFVRKTLDLSAS